MRIIMLIIVLMLIIILTLILILIRILIRILILSRIFILVCSMCGATMGSTIALHYLLNPEAPMSRPISSGIVTLIPREQPQVRLKTVCTHPSNP